MDNWKTNLYADGKLLGSVPIKKGVLQVDSFSPLVLTLNNILRETGMEY